MLLYIGPYLIEIIAKVVYEQKVYILYLCFYFILYLYIPTHTRTHTHTNTHIWIQYTTPRNTCVYIERCFIDTRYFGNAQ